ncbi:MAG: glycerophosphodiester phosphodiesterase [Christensenellales bacterium]|jgi:glycerophosphoryl diester phosphodiesterase
MHGQSDLEAGYPRICAHRGFSTVAPEGSLPAFEAAVALGADEIEVDVWPTKDKDIMVFHDRELDRTTNGHGLITDLSTKEFGLWMPDLGILPFFLVAVSLILKKFLSNFPVAFL